MKTFSRTFLFSSFLILCLSTLCSAQHCSNSNNAFTACETLPVLNSSLQWNYYPSNHTVDIAFHHQGTTVSNWIAWALNPGSGMMIGSQCLVAFQNSAGQIHAYTSPISSYGTMLKEGPLSFEVPRIAAEFNSNEMIIYATIKLPTNRTSFTHVWQFGEVVQDAPQPHGMRGDSLRSFGTIDFATGRVADTGSTSGTSRYRKKNIHGVLNAVSWGILLPLGAIVARYLKVFKAANPAWFYLHVTCQTSAYIIGVAGWVTGLILGSSSHGVRHDAHRNIGITLFALGTLQIFAMFLRPKPDHKYRLYWNLYHQAIGYTVIILSIVNIFKGLEILEPEEKWKEAYIGVLIFLGACVAVLEPYTWYIVLLKRKMESEEESCSNANADSSNGTTNGCIV